MNMPMSAGFEDRRGPISVDDRLGSMRSGAEGEWVHLDARAVKPAIRWSFYAFVFALLFETADIGVSVKPTLIAGAVLIVSGLFQPGVCFRWPPAAFWLSATFLYMAFIANVMSHTATNSGVIYQYFVDVQLLILFWVSFNLMRYDGIARGAIVALILSATIVSALTLTGVTHKTYDTGTTVQRLSAFDSDPNNFGGLMALSILGAIGLALLSRRNTIPWRALASVPSVLIAAMLINTGSRGALVGLAAGLLAFNQGAGSTAMKVRNLIVVIVLMMAFILIGYNTPMVRLRFERTLKEGSLAKREVVYPLAVQMFREKPVLGWGNSTNTDELGRRLSAAGMMPSLLAANGSTFKATHNMILYTLTSSGVLGTIPFLAAIWLCLWSAWRARRGDQGILPFALGVTVFVLDMSVDGQHWKQHWIFMAYALASGYPALWRRPETIRPRPLMDDAGGIGQPVEAST